MRVSDSDAEPSHRGVADACGRIRADDPTTSVSESRVKTVDLQRNRQLAS